MAKTATHDPPAPPAPLPPPAPDSEPPATAPASRLPDGVQMHQAGALPYTANREAYLAKTPQGAPPGWQGTYGSCGGCGAFLGTSDRCPACAPAALPPHIVNAGPQ